MPQSWFALEILLCFLIMVTRAMEYPIKETNLNFAQTARDEILSKWPCVESNYWLSHSDP